VDGYDESGGVSLTALGGKFGLDEVHEVAYGMELLQFRGLKLDFEARLDGDDEVDVIERVPLGDLGSGKAGREDQGVVIEEIVKDGRELRVDFFSLHWLDYRWRAE
jgi:hypothetical protein